MSTARLWLAFAAPLVILAVGSLASRWRGLATAEPLTRTMLGGCVRLSGPIRATLRGLWRGVRVATAGTARVATAGLFGLVLAVFAGIAVWVALAFVVATVTTLSRVVVIGWVAVVAIAGLKPTKGQGTTNPLFDRKRHIGALRLTLLTKAQREADGTPWDLSGFRTHISELGDQSVAYRLPDGITAAEVVKQRDLFIANLRLTGVPSERWVIERDGEVNRLRVTIKAERAELTPRAPGWLGTPTRWRDPVVMGRDVETTRDVTAPTHDIGLWLVGGRTGSGKTTALRPVVAHFALDPAARVWVADGKGNRGDWLPLAHRCERFLWVHSPTATADYLQMLRDAMAEVERRNARGGDHPGMLVLLEEFVDLRLRLDQREQAEHDRLLIRLAQTCRSANVLVIAATQRPEAKLMPTSIRAQAGVMLCMKVRSLTDAEMILGYRPEDESVLSFDRGEGLLETDGGSASRFRADYLDNPAWHALCRTLPDVHAPAHASTPQDAPGPGPQDAPVTAPRPKAAPVLPPGRAWTKVDGRIGHAPALLVLVDQVLCADGQGAITSGRLAERLPLAAIDHGTMRPEDVAGYTATSLGTALRGYDVDTSKRSLKRADLPKGQQRWVARDDVTMALGRHLDTSANVGV